MFAEERRNEILSLVSNQSSVSVNDLAEYFNVSSATIRTDLNFLANSAKIKRTHGGAVSIDKSNTSPETTSYVVRKSLNVNEKISIAKKAMKEITEDLCIALDASSTCYELAKLISGIDFRLTVVTNGLRTATILKENLKLNVIIIGGMIKGESNAIEGLLGAELLDKVHIDCYFFSSSGISLELGFSDFNLQEIELKKLIVKKSTKNIALVDSSKFGKKSISRFASLDSVDYIITDGKLDDKTFQEYNSHKDIVISK